MRVHVFVFALALIGVVLVVLTQVVAPWVLGTAFFPAFRRRRRSREAGLRRRLEEAHQERVEDSLRRNLDDIERERNRKRGR